MSTIKTIVTPSCEFAMSENCSLMERDSIKKAVISFDTKKLEAVLIKLPSTGIGHELSADVTSLFTVKLLNDDGKEVFPVHHEGLEVTISTRFGCTSDVATIKLEGYWDDDWAEIEVPLDDVKQEIINNDQGFFITVTQCSPSGAQHETTGVITGPADLTADMVECVALNLITAGTALFRCPTAEYGDNVFADSDDFANSHTYWINEVEPVLPEHLEGLTKHIRPNTYEFLLEYGQVEIL